jgi:hypothetical protein
LPALKTEQLRRGHDVAHHDASRVSLECDYSPEHVFFRQDADRLVTIERNDT